MARDLSALGYRRIVLSLVSMIVVPTALLLTLGAVMLFLGELQANLLMGILIVSLSGAVVTGVILVWVFVRREANLTALQSDFVSKVSHELRTPLTSIRLFSETLALRRGDAEAEDKCIEGLARESMRLQELIDRLLDWGRMESGRKEFSLQRTLIRDVVKRTVAAFTPVLERRPATLRVDVPDEEIYVDADRAALCDALLNLLTNAIKYGGDPAEIELSVRATPREVVLGVRDNGQGLEEHEHTRIFQKFYRVDDRLSREREGSGLGLAIVKHVVRAHHGRIELESAPGQGSTFSIVLSRRSEPDGSDAKDADAAS
ncbi:MAG: two-component sensor histidine kinase [Myxococcales bacterium]|nr:two-component sensor histidine kinase [Myxococcales bacterium]